MKKMMEYIITTTWRGTDIPPEDWVRWRISIATDGMLLEADAPFYFNPPPPVLPGPADHLWEFEVVELFLLGDNDRYLEVELGPFGHYLVLILNARRRVEQSLLPIDYQATISGDRWRARAIVPKAYLPQGLSKYNAYAIHLKNGIRRHLALFPMSGDAPDFHRLEEFQKLPEIGL
jgi:hypothetical protein